MPTLNLLYNKNKLYLSSVIVLHIYKNGGKKYGKI